MKRLLSLALVAASSAAAYGEEVKTSKTAAINTAINNLYGSVDLRQASYQAASDDKEDSRTLFSVRPTLGTKLFDGKVDTYFTAPFFHRNKTANLDQPYLLHETDVTLLDNEYTTIRPYFDAVFPKGGEVSSSNFHAYLELHTIQKGTAVGDLTPFVALEPMVAYHDKAQTAKASVDSSNAGKNSTALTTNSDGTTTIGKQEPESALEYTVGVNYVPATIKKLTVTGAAILTREYDPQYKMVQSVEGDNQVEKTGYTIRDTTKNQLVLSYKASDTTTISNDFRYRLNGFYASTANTDVVGYQRIENRLVLTYKLF